MVVAFGTSFPFIPLHAGAAHALQSTVRANLVQSNRSAATVATLALSCLWRLHGRLTRRIALRGGTLTGRWPRKGVVRFATSTGEREWVRPDLAELDLPPDWTPAQPVPSAFPLMWFLKRGFPASARFLWADSARHRTKSKNNVSSQTWPSVAAGQSRFGGKRGMRSGLHELPPGLAPWLEVCPAERYSLEMEARRAALLHSPELCFVSDGAASLPAQREVLDLVLEHLIRHEPSRFSVEPQNAQVVAGNRVVHTHTPGYEHTWSEADFVGGPLRLAGMLVQEDMCLMRETLRTAGPPGTLPEYLLVAGAVCFSFSAPEKHMLPLSELHHPAVPGYMEHLDNSMNRFFSALRPERSYWRANFSFGEFMEEASGEEQHLQGVPPALRTAQDARQRLWLRVEYETIRRLPQAQDHIVFTIKSYSDPLSSFEAVPCAAHALAAAVRDCDSTFLFYKGLRDSQAVAAVLSYLDAICAAVGLPSGGRGLEPLG